MVTAIAIEKNYNNHMSIEELQDQKQVKSKNSSRKRPRPSMIPQDFFAKVEFNKIREMLVDLCKVSRVRRITDNLIFILQQRL